MAGPTQSASLSSALWSWLAAAPVLCTRATGSRTPRCIPDSGLPWPIATWEKRCSTWLRNDPTCSSKKTTTNDDDDHDDDDDDDELKHGTLATDCSSARSARSVQCSQSVSAGWRAASLTSFHSSSHMCTQLLSLSSSRNPHAPALCSGHTEKACT